MLATIVAAALVSFRLGAHGLWYDEGFTVGTVDRPAGDALWRIFHWELNQSPIYLVMLGWQRLGDGDAFLRVPSAVFAVATVPVTHLLGRRLFDRRIGALAALFIAVHPFVVQWGQQVRGYSLVVFLVAASTLLLVRAVDDPSTGRVVSYAVVASVAAYAHFFALLVIAAHGLSLLALRPFPRRVAALSAAIMAVLLAPLAHFLLTREGDPLAWVAPPSGAQLGRTARDLAGGGWLQLALLGGGVVLGGVIVARAVRAVPWSLVAWRHVLTALVMVVPPAVTFGLSATVKPLTEPRFLIVLVPGAVLLAALGIDRLLRGWVEVAAVVALVAALGLGVFRWYDREPREEWREAVSAVMDDADAGDLVVTVPSRAVHVVGHYVGRLDRPLIRVGYPDDPSSVESNQIFEVLRAEQAASFLPPEDYWTWRDQNYELVEEQRFAEVLVRRWERS